MPNDNVTYDLTHTRNGNTDEFQFGSGGTPTPSGDVSNSTVTFSEAVIRDNITSGSTLAVLFGKVKKWFSDLKTVAFSGSYNDLTDKPTIPVVPTVGDATITITQGGVTKGSFGVNDTENKTIALDAGGGGGTVPEITATASADALSSSNPTVTVTKTGTDAAPNFDFAFSGLKGAQGNPGQNGQDGSPGAPGADGSDGTSAYCSVSKSGNTATITCTDANGTTTAQISDGTNGSNGSDGAPGADGSSAYCSVSKVGSTATITCTDKNGTTTATVSDGQNGSNGQNGSDGTSAYCSVSKSGSTATITCTDANGTTTAQISDGTEVVANPSGTGSTDLTKLEVGGTVYNIPSGGGGSFAYEIAEINLGSQSGTIAGGSTMDIEVITLPTVGDEPVAFAPLYAGSWQCVCTNIFTSTHPVSGKTIVKFTIRNVSSSSSTIYGIKGLLFYKHSS